MKRLGLEDVPSTCFQGVIPATIATSSKDGEPNVTYLSQVFTVDASHIGLTCQFFNKTKKNVSENPYASVWLHEPLSFEPYRLDLRFVRAETEGPLYETMKMRIEAIASMCGMAGVFRLLSADVYEVLAVERAEGYIDAIPPEQPKVLPAKGLRSELRAMQVVSDRLNRADDLDALLASMLAAFEEELGFAHAMVLVPDESGTKLFTVASRGYGESGIGAEVAIGKGLVGVVAEERRPLRTSALAEDVRYGRAIRGETEGTVLGRALSPEIPLPGLPGARSHLAIPLLVRGELVGVLAVESPEPMGFEEWHEAFLGVLGNQAAMAIARMTSAAEPESAPPPPSTAAMAPAARTRTFRIYRHDDCVFVDGEYLIRNVPGKILWRILRAHVDEGRADFTNRELRLDTSLGLPAIKDNLESRLILLRKRLEQKCPDVRLVRTGRGLFRFEADCRLALVET